MSISRKGDVLTVNRSSLEEYQRAVATVKATARAEAKQAADKTAEVAAENAKIAKPEAINQLQYNRCTLVVDAGEQRCDLGAKAIYLTDGTKIRFAVKRLIIQIDTGTAIGPLEFHGLLTAGSDSVGVAELGFVDGSSFQLMSISYKKSGSSDFIQNGECHYKVWDALNPFFDLDCSGQIMDQKGHHFQFKVSGLAQTQSAPGPTAQNVLPLPRTAGGAGSVIPVAFRGSWNSKRGDCGTGNNDSALQIDEKYIRFYESGGPVDKVEVHGNIIKITARLTSEEDEGGRPQTETREFALTVDGSALIADPSGSRYLRYRCKSGRN